MARNESGQAKCKSSIIGIMKKQRTGLKTFQFYFITLLLGLIVWVATNADFYTVTENLEPGSSENLLIGLLICGAGVLLCTPLLIPISVYFYFLHRWKKANSVSFRCTANVLFGFVLSSGWALLIHQEFTSFQHLWPFIFGACTAGIIVEIISLDPRTILSEQNPIDA